MKTSSSARNVLNVPARMLLLAGSGHANGLCLCHCGLSAHKQLGQRERGREVMRRNEGERISTRKNDEGRFKKSGRRQKT